MKRKIIRIDHDACNGCGACAAACHEGAIEMIDGKAVLTREDYCDGLGDCLPACPAGAITFEEREAPAYNEQAVLEAKRQKNSVVPESAAPLPCGCPGTQARALNRKSAGEDTPCSVQAPSRLAQWPVQIKLAPIHAPYFDGADLLVAADCTAYAYGTFHEDFIKGRVVLIGCPKLDEGDYSEKLGLLLSANNIRSITVARMEVPCCGGIENAAARALAASGKDIPLRVLIVTTDGTVRESQR